MLILTWLGWGYPAVDLRLLSMSCTATTMTYMSAGGQGVDDVYVYHMLCIIQAET